MSKLRVLAILASFCALAHPAWASTVIFRTDAQLVALSERVVHGRVTATRTTRGPQGRIYTVTTLQIIEDLTGIDGTSVEIWELGGAFGGEYLYVGGGVDFRVGEEVLVCLERGPLGLRTVALGFSKFDVLPEVNGERRLRRNLRDTVVVGGAVSRDPFLSEFRNLASQTTGRAPRQGRAPQVGEELQSAEQPYTLLGSPPFRWVQADSATPVTWYINTSAASPLTTSDAATELQVALSAWTSPPSASIILQYGGTTLQSDADGPFTGLASAAGVITFEDPNNEINGSVLAVGGGWAGGNGGTVNGTSFAAFIRGYVIFQNAADLSASFRTPPNFTRVLIHELGHAIGLGHTQTDGSVANAQSNIMYPSCCVAATPMPPNIGPDDLTGLNFVYPSGAPSCTYSINPTSSSVAYTAGSGTVSVTTQAGCGWTASSNSAFLGITSGSSGSGSGNVGYSVGANAATSGRSGTLTIAGATFTVNQAAAPCTYTLTPTSTSATAAGGSGSVTVTAGTGCAWTATSNTAFLGITFGASGSGNGSVGYSVSANGVSARTGTLTIGGQTFTVSQLGTGPTVSLDRASLRYGATKTGGTVTSQTTAQILRLSQTAGPAVSWTVASNQPWLSVSPASGSGAADLTVTVAPASVATPVTTAGTVTLTLTGAGNFLAPVGVTLVTITTGTSTAPAGLVDTPLANATGVVGAIPVTGWSLDDVEVASVFICRATVAGETVAADGRCGGAAQVFLGEAAFIDDARPDVAAAFPTRPRNYRGGWGYMVLTNMLPGQGNGVYSLSMYAQDREGYVVLLGSRTITCDNAHATRPFGTIDTPTQGGTASGTAFVNFGWALTPLPKFIPNDGSTMMVYVDGVAIGSPTYNNYRSDIATLFPGLNNTSGAIGYRVIDTTALANGMHTIAWTVADNLGAVEGIGSRYFRVSNGVGALTTAVESALTAGNEPLSAAPALETSLLARVGWNPSATWRRLAPNSAGRTIVRSEEVSRIELQFDRDGGALAGYLRVGDTLAPLPVGSRVDAAAGRFTWQPGLGFVGAYDLVFVRHDGSRILARQDVRVVLQPKGSGFVGPQVVIDTPRMQADVAQPFVLAGWAADLNALDGTGIATLHAWAYPLTGGPPVFLGATSYGGYRPDVAGVHGDQFGDSGFGLVIQGLVPGNYDVAVFPWSTETADFLPARTVRLTIR